MIKAHQFALACLLAATTVATFAQEKWPEKGFVPDAESAMKIAEAIWFPIYGQSIYRQRPYQVTKKGENWVVQGTLPPDTVGGTAVAVIAQQDGRIIRVFHTK